MELFRVIPHERLQLVLPNVSYRDSFLSAYEELSEKEKNDWIYLGPYGTDDLIHNRFDEYVRILRERETISPPHFVRSRTYSAVQDERVLGRIGLRFELNELLANFGGHVGYIVRPSARGQGVATAMLAFELTTFEAKAIGKLLLTCDEDNLASERAILKNGGGYELTMYPEGRVVGKKRFWIAV
jgi:predicted acetyltransferase